jgi:antitoxin ParD1/3/4
LGKIPRCFVGGRQCQILIFFANTGYFDATWNWTMNVSLTDELERLIRKKVASGRYASTSEVVREALRLLERHDRSEDERRSTLLRDAWSEGLASGPGGELDFNVIRRKARSRLKVKRAKG